MEIFNKNNFNELCTQMEQLFNALDAKVNKKATNLKEEVNEEIKIIDKEYDPACGKSFFKYRLDKLEDCIVEASKDYKQHLLNTYKYIDIYESNKFSNEIFKYYCDFQNKVLCFEAACFLVKDYLNIKISNVQLKAAKYDSTPKHILQVDNQSKEERRREQKRDYYNRNKQKFQEYRLKKDELIKQYQKDYRAKNK